MAAEQFNHGSRVIEVTDGSRPIRTVESAVIGAVVTAPDSEAAVAASLTLGSGTSALTFTADTPGIAGNEISVRLKNPGTVSASLAVTVEGKAITVSLATDNTGAVTSTAAAIKTAADLVAGVSALVTIVSGGTGVVTPAATTRLGGGLDEAFPLNTPVRIAGSRTEAARLGSTGTGPAAIDDILDQAGAVIVVIRVDPGEDAEEATAAVLAGIELFLEAETALGIVPRVLIAPEYSAQKEVADALVSVGTKLRAIACADGPNTSDAAAINYASQFGSDRLVICDPWLVKGGVDHAPSATWAGIVAKTDNELGYSWSPSNKEILGFTGTSRAVAYRNGDPTCAANLLNSANVTTIVFQRGRGLRMWGNRTTSADPRFAFITARRIGDIINDSIARAHLWAVDRRLSRTYFEDVTEGVNAFLKTQINAGHILGGTCWADPEDNQAATVNIGQARFKFDYTPPPVAEDVVFESIQVDTYIPNLFA